MSAALVLDRFLPYRLSVASNAVSSAIAAAYRTRFGLKIPEWRLIAVLAEQDRATPLSLRTATRMDKIAVSRAAAALLERGLIASRPNPEDGRSHYLSLTSEGRALYQEVAPLALKIEAELMTTFTDPERRQLEALLRKLEGSTAAIRPSEEQRDALHGGRDR